MMSLKGRGRGKVDPSSILFGKKEKGRLSVSEENMSRPGMRARGVIQRGLGRKIGFSNVKKAFSPTRKDHLSCYAWEEEENLTLEKREGGGTDRLIVDSC